MQIQRALEGLGSKIAYNNHESNGCGALVAVELLCRVGGCGYTCGYRGPRLCRSRSPLASVPSRPSDSTSQEKPQAHNDTSYD